MKKIICIIVLCISAISLTACGYTETATEKEAQVVDAQLSQYSKGQPIPAYDWSLERDLVIKMYNLRNKKAATHTVWRSDYGMIEGDTPSIGYGIPYDTSLTNPLQLEKKRVKTNGGHMILEGTVEQQEPNGIFASKNTTATWIMSVDKKTGQIMPLYIEGKVTVYPYPVKVDYEKNRVYKAGEPSTTISIGTTSRTVKDYTN